jgi:hypothetical protein
MASVKMSTDLMVPAQVVWNTIGTFNGLPDWHPLVESSKEENDGKTKTRTLSIAGGGTIVEKLENVDPKERRYSYSILSGPLPVSGYQATLKVRDTGLGCSVEWESEFDAAGAPENEAVAAIRGVYEAGFENLRKMFGG